jgi:hypothetical protein
MIGSTGVLGIGVHLAFLGRGQKSRYKGSAGQQISGATDGYSAETCGIAEGQNSEGLMPGGGYAMPTWRIRTWSCPLLECS